MIETYEEVPAKIPSVFKSRDRRPCVIYQDVNFEKPARLSYITFRNYYSYTVRVDYQEVGSSIESFKTLIKKKQLMEDPHYEDDSQEYHIIDLTEVNELKAMISKLRFYLKQPSPNWRKIGINDIKCYVRVWKKNQKLEFVPSRKKAESEEEEIEGEDEDEEEQGSKSRGKPFFVDPQVYEKNVKWFVGNMLFSDLEKLRKHNSNTQKNEETTVEQNYYFSDDFEEVTTLIVEDQQ